MDRILLNEKLVVPAHYVPFEIFNKFTITIKEEGEEDYTIQLYEQNEDGSYSFARGGIPLLQQLFGHVEWVDDRKIVEMKHKITFTKELRPEQRVVIDTIVKNHSRGIGGFGQVDCPPRFGKTVCMAALACHTGLKTLFLCHQDDLSKQAIKTFYDMTNVKELEEEKGYPIIGIVEDLTDLDKYDICFMTYQKLISKKNFKLLKEKYKDSFGMVLVDEVHKAAAEKYSSVINNFNSYFRLGWSGTIERKDELHIVNEFVLGPVIASGETAQVPCTVHVVRTNITLPFHPRPGVKRDKMFFIKLFAYLAENQDRNTLITDYIASFANAGHSSVALTNRVAQADLIVSRLVKLGIAAEAFHAKKFKNKKAKEECLNRCRSGETKVLVAYRTMMLGIDVPRWTAVFNLSPIANAPNVFQEVCRVRTPFPGKVRGYIVDFVDNNMITINCYRARRKEYIKQNFEIVGDWVDEKKHWNLKH